MLQGKNKKQDLIEKLRQEVDFIESTHISQGEGTIHLAYKTTNELVSEMNGIVSNEIKLIYGHSKKTKIEIEEETKKIKVVADRMKHNVMDIEKTVIQFEELAELQGIFFEKISSQLDQLQ